MKACKLLLIMLFGGLVSANCGTGWEYCGTFQLPNTFWYDSEGAPSTYANFILTDITQLSLYNVQLANSTLTNVYFKVTNTTKHGWSGPTRQSDKLIYLNVNSTLNATAGATLQICLNGSYMGNIATDPRAAIRSEPTYTLVIGNFTQYYHRVWYFLDPATNRRYNFIPNETVSTLTAWCSNYAEIRYNLSKTTLYNNSGSGFLDVQTIQEPKFFLSLGNLTPSIRQDTDHNLYDGYYVPAAGGLNYTLYLVDYTGGQFYNSELKIERNIQDPYNSSADSVGIMSVQRFDQSNLQYINLAPNVQYNFIVTGNGSVRNLGAVYLDNLQTTRYVIVSVPNVNPFASRWDSLTIDLDGDYDSRTIYCGVNTSASTTSYLSVYYANQTPYRLFSAITPQVGTSVVLTQSIADENLTYYAICYTNDTTYGVRTVGKLIKLYNSTQYYDGLGELDFGNTVLGENKTSFLNWMSVVIIVIVAGLFSEVSMGTGALAIALATSLMWYIGFFTIPYIIVASMLTIAVMMKLSEKRFGVIT